MIDQNKQSGRDATTPKSADAAPVGRERILELTRILQKYKAGKANLERRIVESENWWKLRNGLEEAKREESASLGFKSASGWLHNVIVSKHADAMEAFPEPNILPREEGDRREARILSKILPCILEQNEFESKYSDAEWRKGKTGTGVYKIFWDAGKLGGLGDIAVEVVNLLNLFWEPGIADIQKSRYIFQTELQDNDLLEQQYPQLVGKLKSSPFTATKFLYDDAVDTTGKSTVVDCYYHTFSGGKAVLQYCKFVGDEILSSTENDPQMAERGLYDHGMYPYVFDALFPIEGSPCGYGFVDLCRNPQIAIDLMKTAFVRNAMAGATPRYFKRADGSVNAEQFLDLNCALIDVNGNLGEDSLKPIDYNPLSSVYVEFLNGTIQELRETSGNTETATGSTQAGVTAASAIAALQEASGKGSRDATATSYRAYGRIINLCIELIRQFYDLPRQFRITGDLGEEQFVSYSNRGLQPQYQGNDFGMDMGYRLPVFDIRVSPQKRNSYTKMSQNELALQFFQMGFFNPQLSDQALLCLDIMDFDGKDQIMQKVSENGTMLQMMQLIENYAVNLAAKHGDQQALLQLQQIIAQVSGSGAAPMSGGSGNLSAQIKDSDAQRGGQESDEHSRVKNARERAAEASQPDGGKVIQERGKG